MQKVVFPLGGRKRWEQNGVFKGQLENMRMLRKGQQPYPSINGTIPCFLPCPLVFLHFTVDK